MPDDAIHKLGESELRDGLCLGRLVGWSDAGEPRVVLDRCGLGPRAARIASHIDTDALTTATGAELLLAVCDAAIVIMAVLRERGFGAPVSADRERIELHARDEIVLRCGEASLVMRRNGRIVLTGSYVETHSKGINRIKGGTVQIN